jgi:hypothetical protein
MRGTLVVSALSLAALSACARSGATPLQLADAHRFVSIGNLAAADSALVACSEAHPDDERGSRCRYQLVFVRLDPAYPGSPRKAVEAAADYLARDVKAPGRDEMTLLARIAAERELLLARLDSSRARVAQRAEAVQTPLRDDGSAKLREELDRARLARIKRRLSSPRP